MLRKTLTAAVMGACMIFSTSMAEEVIKAPDINIEESRILYSDAARIIGTMKLKNNTDAYFSDVYYSLGLKSFSGNDAQSETCIMGQTDPIRFSIGANQEKEIYFAYDIPEYFPEATDELAVTFSTRTMRLSNGEASIPLTETLNNNEKGFLLPEFTTEEPVWVIEESTVGSDTGPNINSSTKPLARFHVKSTFSEIITVIPKVNIYQRSKAYNDKPVYSFEGNKITIAPNEEKSIELELPVMPEPESYFIRIELCNEKGEAVSHEYDYRYVVEGMNAKILRTYLTTENENDIKLNIFAIGSADGMSDIDGVTLSCKVEANGEIVKDEKFQVNLDATLTSKVLSLDKYEGVTTFNIKLEKNGVIYDEYSFSADLNNLESTDFEFLDVTDDKTKKAVGILTSIGMLSGYPDGTFRPNNNITRAEFTVIATRLAGLELVTGQPSVFNDVVEHHWAKDFINLAHANGCISGYGDGIFKPDNNVTIAESFTILINVLNYKELANSNGVMWPLNYLEIARKTGLNKDVEYTSYMEPATREKVAKMTLNALLHKYEMGGI